MSWAVHRRKSSRVYWVIGRMAGSSVREDGGGGAAASARRAGEWSDSESADGHGPRGRRRARARADGVRVRPRTPWISRIARTPRAASAASAHCCDRGAHPRALAEQAIDEGLLAGRRLGLAGARRKQARRRRGVHGDQRVAVEDADQMRVPPHADALPEQREWDRIERAVDLDVPIGVHRALAGAEQRKRDRRRAAAAPAARPRRNASRPGGGSCRGSGAARSSDSSGADAHCARRGCRSGGPSARCF